MPSNRVTLTEEQVTEIANSREFFVYRYGEAHEKLRKLTRRMHKDEKLVLTNKTGRGFFYVSPRLAKLNAEMDEFTLASDSLSPEDM